MIPLSQKLASVSTAHTQAQLNLVETAGGFQAVPSFASSL